MYFFAKSFVVEMRSFFLLASMEQILIPNCSLLYLHSNNMNSLMAINTLVIRPTIKSGM